MNYFKFLGGLFSLSIGIRFFIYLVKHPSDSENDITRTMLQGYIGSFGAIVLGIVLIFNEVKKLFP